MSKADNKTQPTKQSVTSFIDALEHETRRSDSKKLLKMMKEITGEKPAMWGPSIIGFGKYHYKYDSGREGDFMMTGFAARKANMAVYIMPGFKPYAALLAKLGKHKTGGSCLYINKLADVDEAVLRTLVEKAYADMKKKYGG